MAVKTVKDLRDLLMEYPGDLPITVGIDRIAYSAGQPPFLMGVEPILTAPDWTEEERAEDLENLKAAEDNGDLYVETPHVFPRVVLWTALPHDDGEHGRMVGDVFIARQRRPGQSGPSVYAPPGPPPPVVRSRSTRHRPHFSARLGPLL